MANRTYEHRPIRAHRRINAPLHYPAAMPMGSDIFHVIGNSPEDEDVRFAGK